MGPLSERDARNTLSVAQHRGAAEVGRPGGAGTERVVDKSTLTPRSARPQSGPRPGIILDPVAAVRFVIDADPAAAS